MSPRQHVACAATGVSLGILAGTAIVASLPDRGECLERGPEHRGLMPIGKILVPHTYPGECHRWQLPAGR